MPISILNLPDPFVLMDSMRSIGYSFQAAICDIIDNSISAGAKNIDVFRPVNYSNLFVEILDDGSGMTRNELFDAMRYGKDRTIQRNQQDLGRFGLGLKSASLSQCKVLTVVTKKDGMIVAMRWDEDHVKNTKSWSVLELEEEDYESIPNFSLLKDLEHGTLVVWQNFDVITKSAGENAYKALCEQIELAESSIRLIYHRFMDRNYSHPSTKINFFINRNKLTPLDPFLIYKTSTDKRNQAVINESDSKDNIQRIICQPFILPFQKELTAEDQEMMGGLENMAKMQGFYIYRNFRLISYGSWFGMRPSNELAKYARILVDIPSALDDKWGIDVKKEKSQIPIEVKKQLRKVVEEACQGSHKRIKKRTATEKDDKTALWKISRDRLNRKVFEVNKESPLISAFKNTLDNKQVESLDFILDSLSATLSYIDIYDSYATNKTSDNLDILNDQEQEVVLQAKELAESLVNQYECDLDTAIKEVCHISPFSSIDNLDEKLRKEFN